MDDGLQVNAPIAVLDEKSLIVLVLVGSADDGEIPELRMVVEHGRAGALLEVGGGHDLGEFGRWQACALFLPIGRDDGQGIDVQGSLVQQAGREDDLRQVSFLRIVFREDPGDGLIPALDSTDTRPEPR